jgi:hypothetical protein
MSFKVMHLIVYIMSMLARLLNNLNNMASKTPLDAPTLNHNFEIERIIVLTRGTHPCLYVENTLN